MTNPSTYSAATVNEAGTREKQPRVLVKPEISILSVLNNHMVVSGKLDRPKLKQKKKTKRTSQERLELTVCLVTQKKK